MKREEEGIVVEVQGSIAFVRASRHGDCKNCGACPGDNAMTVEAQNPVGAQAGQRVAFEIQEANMLLAAFIVYIMPLLAIFIGAVGAGVLAQRMGQTALVAYQVGGGLLAFIIAVLLIKMYDKFVKNNEKMQPVVTRILS